jgi:hypothetical protein
MKKVINAFKSNKRRDEVIKSYMLLLEQWGVPVEEKTVFCEYGATHINIAGDKSNPPLLLVQELVIILHLCGFLTQSNYLNIFVFMQLMLSVEQEEACQIQTMLMDLIL